MGAAGSRVPSRAARARSLDPIVGDFNSGTLYRFTLNSERTGFVFDDKGLQDKVLNLDDSRIEITFGGGFLGITDIDFGPDGLLYVLNIGDGSIYRIMPLKELEAIPLWIEDDISDWSDIAHDDLVRKDYSVNDLALRRIDRPFLTSGPRSGVPERPHVSFVRDLQR